MTKTAMASLRTAAPVQDEELRNTTQGAAARALLAEIVATDAPRRSREKTRRRRWLVAPVSASAVAAAVLTVALLNEGGSTPSAAAATLEKAAAVARQQQPLTPGPGQFLYTKSVDAYTDTTVPASGDAYTVLVPHVREIWLGPSGGRLYETSGTPRFLSATDRARWIAAGRPELAEPPSTTPLPPTLPLDLPSDPDALYVRLKHDARGHGSGLYSEMFTLVGDSLRETAATPEQRAALYQVAARIPGVSLLGRVKDSAGRSGLGVALDGHGIRFLLIFDPQTSALLGEEEVALPGNHFGYQAGDVTGYATYLVQRIVDSQTSTR